MTNDQLTPGGEGPIAKLSHAIDRLGSAIREISGKHDKAFVWHMCDEAHALCREARYLNEKERLQADSEASDEPSR